MEIKVGRASGHGVWVGTGWGGGRIPHTHILCLTVRSGHLNLLCVISFPIAFLTSWVEFLGLLAIPLPDHMSNYYVAREETAGCQRQGVVLGGQNG